MKVALDFSFYLEIAIFDSKSTRTDGQLIYSIQSLIVLIKETHAFSTLYIKNWVLAGHARAGHVSLILYC